MKQIGSVFFIFLLLCGCGRENAPMIASTQVGITVGHNPVCLESGLAPDTLLVSCFDAQRVDVINTKTNQVLQPLNVRKGPQQLIVHARHQRVYCLHLRENALAILSGNPLRVEQELGMGGIALAGGAINPVTNDLWVCDGLSSVYVLTSEHAVKLREKFQAGRYPHAVAFAPSGNTAFVTLKGENAVVVMDVKTGKEQSRIAVGIYPQDILRIGSTLCVSNYGSQNVSLIDLTTLQEKIRIPVRRKPHGLATMGQTLWVACEDSYRVMAISTIQAKAIGSIKVDFYPGAIKALPNGNLAVANPGHNQVVLITPKELDFKE